MNLSNTKFGYLTSKTFFDILTLVIKTNRPKETRDDNNDED